MRAGLTILAAVAAASLVTGTAGAAVFVVPADSGDFESLSDGTTSNGVSGALRVGSRTLNSSATPTAANPIFPFALPALGPGETVLAATLSVLTKTQTSNLPVANADLYGLPHDPAPLDPTGSYYFAGPDDTTAGVTKLQDNYLVPADGAAADTRKVSVDISAYIQSLYDAGAQPGDFALLRMSYDQPVNLDAHNRYLVWSKQATGTTDNPPERWPLLEITTIPEPATFGILAAGASLGAFARRRRAM